MRRAAKVDTNQGAILQALRDAGWLVAPTHQIGHGFPDAIACSPRGELTMLEIKAIGGRLTRDELLFAALGWPVRVVWTASDALAAVGASAGEVQ